MRFRALTPLLSNPWLVALLGLAGFLNLFALIVAAGLAASSRAAGVEFDLSRMPVAAAFAGSVYGILIGGALSEAARCSSSWSLPGFRRTSVVDFVSVGGVITVAQSGLMVAAGLVPPGMAIHTAALTFAAYALGGAVLLCPEGSLILMLALPFWLLTALGVWNPARVLPTNRWHQTAVALGLTALAILLAFGTRTYRWAAVTPGSPWEKRSIWQTLPTVSWWPRRRRRESRGGIGDETPATFIGLSLHRCMIAAFRATRPSLRAVRAIGPVVFVGVGLAYFADTSDAGGVRATWWTLFWYGALWLQREDGPSFEQLPWPRRHLLKVSYAGDLFEGLWYLFVQGTVMTALFAWVGPTGTTPAEVARVVAATAAALPLAQWWFRTHGGWRPRRSPLVVLSILGWMALGHVYVPAIAFGLPRLLRDPGLQIAAYATLFAIGQVLHWRRLRRYFSTGDLVGAAT